MYTENFKKRLFSSTWRISVAQRMIHMKLHVACLNVILNILPSGGQICISGLATESAAGVLFLLVAVFTDVKCLGILNLLQLYDLYSAQNGREQSAPPVAWYSTAIA